MTTALPTPSELVVPQAGFRKLKMKHRRVIARHLAGESNKAIEMSLGVHSGYVSALLRDNRVEKLLEVAYRDFDRELKALLPGAIDAIRRATTCGDTDSELKAADMALKANHKYTIQPELDQTAEDVIERIMEKINPDGSRVRLTERRRFPTALTEVRSGE